MTKSNIDYKKLGLKSGIEIHAQLEGKKLFCDCPTEIREDKPDFEISRKLKAVVGETGEIDVAAAREQAKNKTFVYQGYSDTTCLVETDEEPPHLMNEGALNLALQMCKFFNAKIVDEVQIMRKTVVDGSNTGGFQRTSLVGFNGKVEVDKKDIVIESVCIEEDACKIVERKAECDIYNLSRLGIPLIEIATGPNMKTPKEVAEVASKIGMYLRSLTPNKGQSIKRGLGTIRQDVNVSIAKGERVEIKGAQDLKMIPTLVDYEILRQMKLVDLKERIEKGELVLPEFNDYKDVSSILKNTACKFVHDTISKKNVVLGLKIPGFKGVIGEETCPGRRVGSEISDYGKHAGVGGMIHSDEKLEKYKFSESEVNDLKATLEVGDNDAFILIADKKSTSINAIELIKERILRLSEGVIKEVRKANADGTTTYMRPMPSSSRMYPETDTLPIVPNIADVEVGKTIEEKIECLTKQGVKNKDIAEVIAKEYDSIFCKLKDKFEVNTLASNIVSGATIIEPDVKILDAIFSAMDKGVVPKNAYLDILELIKSGKSVEEAIKTKESMPKAEVEKIVKDVLSKNPDATMRDMGKIMGAIMGASKGKADGKLVSELLRGKLK